MDFKPILRERACAVCLRNEKLLMVNMLDSVLGERFWMPPGGGVEEEESLDQTAARETREETGVVVSVLPETKLTKEYTFEFDELTYLTRTHFFIAQYEDDDSGFDPTQRESIILAHDWAPLEVAFERLNRWEPVQTAVYELVFPQLRDRRGTDFI